MTYPRMQETNAMYKAANRKPSRWLNVLGAGIDVGAATGCGVVAHPFEPAA